MIVVAGGSGYLGSSVISYLQSSQEHEIVNISSKKSGLRGTRLKEFLIDLTKYEDVLGALSSLEEKSVLAIINLAGRSKRRSQTDPVLSSFLSLTHSYNHDVEILFNLSKFMSENSKFFQRDAKLIDVGSLWASHTPFSGTYLDLGNEPDLSVLLAKTSKKTLVKYLARELGKMGFTVNQITPGWFPKPSGTPREDYIKGIVERIPIGRIGKPMDLFPVIDMLISSRATYVNGQEIVVDGGFSIY
jgi:gluconate 5-dehydrogenase